VMRDIEDRIERIQSTEKIAISKKHLEALEAFGLDP